MSKFSKIHDTCTQTGNANQNETNETKVRVIKIAFGYIVKDFVGFLLLLCIKSTCKSIDKSTFAIQFAKG